MTVKVFISWSGTKSNDFARVLRTWIPSVIQAAKPYYSTDDVIKGSRWSAEISKELEESQVGVICMTRENLHEPWIMFEAGALSKNLGVAKVVPVLFGVEPTDLQGPLAQFQAAKFKKSEIKRVMSVINRELGDDALESNVFDAVFNKWWGELDKVVQEVLERPDELETEKPRSDRELIEEILALTRTVSSSGATKKSSVSPAAIQELVEYYDQIVGEVIFAGATQQLNDKLLSMRKPLNYLISSLVAPSSLRMELSNRVKSSASILDDSPASRQPSASRSRDVVDLNEEDFDDIPF